MESASTFSGGSDEDGNGGWGGTRNWFWPSGWRNRRFLMDNGGAATANVGDGRRCTREMRWESMAAVIIVIRGLEIAQFLDWLRVEIGDFLFCFSK